MPNLLKGIGKPTQPANSKSQPEPIKHQWVEDNLEMYEKQKEKQKQVVESARRYWDAYDKGLISRRRMDEALNGPTSFVAGQPLKFTTNGTNPNVVGTSGGTLSPSAGGTTNIGTPIQPSAGNPYYVTSPYYPQPVMPMPTKATWTPAGAPVPSQPLYKYLEQELNLLSIFLQDAIGLKLIPRVEVGQFVDPLSWRILLESKGQARISISLKTYQSYGEWEEDRFKKMAEVLRVRLGL